MVIKRLYKLVLANLAYVDFHLLSFPSQTR